MTRQGATGIGLAVVMFLGLSGDSLAVLAPLFIDTVRSLQAMVLLGAATAIAAMAVAAVLLARVADRAEGIARRAEAVSPYVMMLAGLYVMWDSGTDAL